MKKPEHIHGLSSKEFAALERLHDVTFQPVDKNLIKKLLRVRPTDGHKGSFGHALIIAGSEGRSGAALLTSEAALKTGCGLVSALIPEHARIPLLSRLPEAMIHTRTSARDLRDLDLSLYDAIGFGPGAGTGEETNDMLLYLLENYNGPLVIDADGLTALSQNKGWYGLLDENKILTPHPVEFSRLCLTGSSRNELLQAQIKLNRSYKCPILVKGRNTTLVNKHGVLYNTTGNSGMATAGSGDVLTGIITSLCAQGYPPAEASVIGTFLHGYAGDAAAKECSMHGMVASDIIDKLKSFFLKFE